ncbi:DUF6063 family protein [Candidatus Lokiarchaeum ossiferum]|uniref:DUF6063 family protein n=1 Tax=Candidatus Lokiarchaeum ossiferum TaxID=2951803 RepID=UPI00352E08DC
MEIGDMVEIVNKAGRILYYGLEFPKKIMYIHEYSELFREYQINSALQIFVETLAESLNLNILAVEKTGVYLSPSHNSPFSPNLSDIPVLGKESNRGLYALILMAVAAYFFPTPDRFQDQGYSSVGVTTEKLHDFITGKINEVIDKFGEEILATSAESPHCIKLLADYRKLHKESEINSKSTALYFIKTAFDHLKHERLITEESDEYLPTNKFRIFMEEFSTNENYLSFLKGILLDDQQEDKS